MTSENRSGLDELERRYYPVTGLEVRAPEEDSDGSIPMEGYASVFGATANIMGLFTEEVMPGAFRKTIRDGDIRLLINHNSDLVLARSRIQNRRPTLRLSEDDIGLRVEAEMGPTTYAKDLAVTMERGEVNQMSIAFRAVQEKWDWDAEPPHRQLLELGLREASVVTFPAFEATEANLRSLSGNPEELAEEIERLRGLLSTDTPGRSPASLRAAIQALEARGITTEEPRYKHSDIERRRRITQRRLYELGEHQDGT